MTLSPGPARPCPSACCRPLSLSSHLHNVTRACEARGPAPGRWPALLPAPPTLRRLGPRPPLRPSGSFGHRQLLAPSSPPAPRPPPHLRLWMFQKTRQASRLVGGIGGRVGDAESREGPLKEAGPPAARGRPMRPDLAAGRGGLQGPARVPEQVLCHQEPERTEVLGSQAVFTRCFSSRKARPARGAGVSASAPAPGAGLGAGLRPGHAPSSCSPTGARAATTGSARAAAAPATRTPGPGCACPRTSSSSACPGAR